MKYLLTVFFLSLASALSAQLYVLENPGGLPGVKITVYHTDTTTHHIGAGTPVSVYSLRNKLIIKGEGGIDFKMPLDSIVSINSVDPSTISAAKDAAAEMFSLDSTNKTVALATYTGGGASNITAGKKMVKVTVASGTLTVTTNSTTVTLSASTPHSTYIDEAFVLGRVLYLTPAYTIDCTGCTAYVVTVN